MLTANNGSDFAGDQPQSSLKSYLPPEFSGFNDELNSMKQEKTTPLYKSNYVIADSSNEQSGVNNSIYPERNSSYYGSRPHVRESAKDKEMNSLLEFIGSLNYGGYSFECVDLNGSPLDIPDVKTGNLPPGFLTQDITDEEKERSAKEILPNNDLDRNSITCSDKNAIVANDSDHDDKQEIEPIDRKQLIIERAELLSGAASVLQSYFRQADQNQDDEVDEKELSQLIKKAMLMESEVNALSFFRDNFSDVANVHDRFLHEDNAIDMNDLSYFSGLSSSMRRGMWNADDSIEYGVKNFDKIDRNSDQILSKHEIDRAARVEKDHPDKLEFIQDNVGEGYTLNRLKSLSANDSIRDQFASYYGRRQAPVFKYAGGIIGGVLGVTAAIAAAAASGPASGVEAVVFWRGAAVLAGIPVKLGAAFGSYADFKFGQRHYQRYQRQRLDRLFALDESSSTANG